MNIIKAVEAMEKGKRIYRSVWPNWNYEDKKYSGIKPREGYICQGLAKSNVDGKVYVVTLKEVKNLNVLAFSNPFNFGENQSKEVEYRFKVQDILADDWKVWEE